MSVRLAARRAAFLRDLEARWPDALAAWSAHTLLRRPTIVDEGGTAGRGAAAGDMIASIRLSDSTIFVNAGRCLALQLDPCALALLAHEIGHHIYVPGNLSDHARLFSVTRRRLAGLPEHVVPFVTNLWADTLINDRLQRRAGVDILAVYRHLFAARQGAPDHVWRVYMRTFELLWRQRPGTLVEPDLVTREHHGDALLCSRLARAFASDWVRGGGRFAAVLYRWLHEDLASGDASTFAGGGLFDMRDAALDAEGQPAQGLPEGVLRRDPAEDDEGGLLDSLSADPSDDDDENDDENGDSGADGDAGAGDEAGDPSAQARLRSPAEVGDLLRAMGAALDEAELTARYYRSLAAPHLIPFPTTLQPRAEEPQLEGLDPWDAGDPIEHLDVLESVTRSPRLVPGVTTMRRHVSLVPGVERGRRPLDLDLYIDCSGSMPDPRRQISHLTLAGAILGLSCLRAGGRVQVTLWSTTASSTDGFVRSRQAVLRQTCGYVSGGTRFPLEVLWRAHRDRGAHDPRAHVVVISDDGIDTLLDGTLDNRPGAEVAREALSRAGGGGTLVLNLRQPAQSWRHTAGLTSVGFEVHRVSAWPELVAFAREFSRRAFGGGAR